MRILIQRVTEASVTVDEKEKSRIEKGLLVFVGIEEADNEKDIDYLCRKQLICVYLTMKMEL